MGRKPYEYNLRRLMKQKKISAKVLSERSKVAQSRIYDILRGESTSPTYDTLEKLATGLEISVSDLIYERRK